MPFWLVKVDCCKAAKRKLDPMVRIRRQFLVLAANSEKALSFGEKEAERTAEIGPKWIAFEVREAATVTLPFEIRVK